MSLSDIGKKLLRFPVLFGCGIVLLLLAGITFWRAPMIEELQKQVDVLDQQWMQMQTNSERSTALDEQLQQLIAGAEALQLRLMRASEVAANHEFFYRMERASGVTIRNFNKGNAVDGPATLAKLPKLKHFELLPFNLSVDGDFAAVLRFLNELQQSERIIHIERLNVVQQGGAADPSVLTANIRCYVLGEKS
jgi:Tfp pilus assembly protein PilO